MLSSQYPCRMIWFEEILKGSYKVVLCPRSGEGYFGLARRTYSLQCPPDIAAVRLNRFTFRQCDEAIPTRGSRALRCRSRERSMALPQLPAYVVHKLGQQRVIQEFLSISEYAKRAVLSGRLSLCIRSILSSMCIPPISFQIIFFQGPLTRGGEIPRVAHFVRVI